MSAAEPPAPTFTDSVRAAIEIGAVSCRLVVTDGRQRLRHGVDTHLGGATMGPSGKVVARPLAPEALTATREALARQVAVATDLGADRLRVVGTAPARHATNRAELADLVQDVAGVPLDVLDPESEGRLAFAGALSSPEVAPAAADDPVLVVDIGGGSTEVVLGDRERGPTGSLSLPLGGALVTAAYLDGDPPRPEELSAALSVVELHLDDVRREIPALGPALAEATAVGLGAVVTLAAIEVGLDLDDPANDPDNGVGDGPLHGFPFTREAAEDVFRTLATESAADRAHNPGLPPGRVADIVGACVVLVETMRQFDLDQVVVSQRGLADGVAWEPSPGA